MENEEIEIFKVYADNRIFSKNGKLRCGALWEVSNLGNVRKNGDVHIPYFKKSIGYLVFGGEYFVHRAVAELFLDNPENKPTVDHQNRIRTDNRAINLRWATPKEQAENRDNEANSKRMIGNKNFLGRKHSEETKAKMRAAALGHKNVLGRVWVFNPTTQQSNIIDPLELPNYLAKGYIKGKNPALVTKIGAANLGKIWVINPTTEHTAHITPSELPDYLAKGYVRGRKLKK